MSSTNKKARAARLSKQTKGQHKGESPGRKHSAPGQQPAPQWCVPKSRKGKGRARSNGG